MYAIRSYYGFTGPEQTILVIAKANGVTPKAVHDVMQPQTTGPKTTPGLPEQPVAETGRKTLDDLCRQYGLDAQQVRAALAAKGIQADRQQSLKEIAAAHDSDPHSIYALIYEAVHKP